MERDEWGPVDWEQLRLLGKLPFAKRIRVMLEAQALALSIIRGRVRRRYPNLSQREINLLVLKEVGHYE